MGANTPLILIKFFFPFQPPPPPSHVTRTAPAGTLLGVEIPSLASPVTPTSNFLPTLVKFSGVSSPSPWRSWWPFGLSDSSPGPTWLAGFSTKLRTRPPPGSPSTLTASQIWCTTRWRVMENGRRKRFVTRWMSIPRGDINLLNCG